MFSKLVIILIINSCLAASKESVFRVQNKEFEQLVNGTWQPFGKFAGVNLGITNPGHLPGEVVLRTEDYIRRFQRLNALNVKVIRVYSLLHPEFYTTLLEWNNNHEPIYVLHGTAFPEEKFENHGEGNDLYREDIMTEMKDIIERTVRGAFGTGSVAYRYERGDSKKPVFGMYTSDISQYVLGWVIGGEISPHAVYQTNNPINNNTRQTIEPGYNGLYFETNATTWFESWVAEIMDFTAVQCKKYGILSPISQTNWVTLDGIKNPLEARKYATNDYTSDEDWQELDMTLITPINGASSFYNEHIYPYYPEFLTYHPNGTDGYYTYLERLLNKYNDRPFLITEVGISTSIGQASQEEYGRNHGGVSPINQGTMMHELMMKSMSAGIYGILVFQLHNEWFKKSWNTRMFDADSPKRFHATNVPEEPQRHMWHNVMSAEEGFGIYEVIPDKKLNSKTLKNQLYTVEVSHNEMYLTLEITFENIAEIFIGINNMPSGSTGSSRFSKKFNTEVDSILKISNNEEKFYIQASHDPFLRQYGWWLNNIEVEMGNICPNMKNLNLDYPDLKDLSIDEYLAPSSNIFNEYRQLVKIPTILYPNRTLDNLNDESQGLCLNYTSKVLDMSRLVKTITHQNSKITKIINLPYHVLGYGNPSINELIIMKNHGKNISFIPYQSIAPISFEISYMIGDIQLNEGNGAMDYDLTGWATPRCYCEKAKESFKSFQSVFGIINQRNNNINNTFDFCTCSTNQSWVNVHNYIVKGSSLFLIIAFVSVSIGKIMLKYLTYCYSSKDIKIGTPQTIFYNLIAAGALILYNMMDVQISFVITSPIYLLYLLLIVWDSLILLGLTLFNKWNLYEQVNEEYDTEEHAFVLACHNSSDVLENTLKSLLSKVPGSQIYVADNGSTEKEQKISKAICQQLDKQIHYGHIAFDTVVNGKTIKRGNKTMAQYAAVCSLPPQVKYATCIDDDTRLHETWNVNKVIKYFKNDDDVVVLAYPLTADNPQNDLEWFQAIEYMITGFFKIFHSKVYSTIFNSGAFGTYKVEILKEAFLYHNTDYHGDDLQICLNIHQLKGKTFYNDPNRKHTQNYKVMTATNMVGTTIVPKCWIHSSTVSSCFKSKCQCGNPDLLQQRSKGWFVSAHRFIPKYIQLIFNVNGVHGLWVRFIALYELIILLNEYFAIVYVIFFLKNVGWWMLEGFIIGYAFTVLVVLLFNWKVLHTNQNYIPAEYITIQPILYKIFMITVYRYAGLTYNLFVYTLKHKSGTKIIKRLEDDQFKQNLSTMFRQDACEIEIEKSKTKQQQNVDVEQSVSISISMHSLSSKNEEISIGKVNILNLQSYSNSYNKSELSISPLEYQV